MSCLLSFITILVLFVAAWLYSIHRNKKLAGAVALSFCGAVALFGLWVIVTDLHIGVWPEAR